MEWFNLISLSTEIGGASLSAGSNAIEHMVHVSMHKLYYIILLGHIKLIFSFLSHWVLTFDASAGEYLSVQISYEYH